MSKRCLEPGATVGPYTVLSLLGQGGQATTWRARDVDHREVALKHFSLKEAEDWKAVELFEREAKVLEHLDHPSIPRFHQSFTEGADCFIAQDFVKGRSLSAALEAGEAFDEARLIDFSQQVLEVLDWLHTRAPPVVHRDIKPSNLLLRDDGRVMLIDFGAVQRQLSQGAEGGSTVVGTHGYMAPEQLMGRAEPTSDLYGFAATLVHLATGRHPGDLPTSGLELDFEDHSPLSKRVNAWLKRMLASDPRLRPVSAAAALTELAASPAPPAPPAAKAVHRWRDVRRFLPAGLGMVGLLLGLGVAWSLLSVRPAPEVAEVVAPKAEPEPPFENFVALPVTLGEGGEGVRMEVVASTLYRTRRGPMRPSYTLSASLTNTADQPVLSWKAQVIMRAFGKETRLIWHMVGELDVPLMPGETRLVRFSGHDVAQDSKSVELRFAAPALAGDGAVTSVVEQPIDGVIPKEVGGLARVPNGEKLGRCDGKRCFDYVFTFAQPSRDWVHLRPDCLGPQVLKGGSYNDRHFQIPTTVGREVSVRAGDRVAFRVRCPVDAESVRWTVGQR